MNQGSPMVYLPPVEIPDVFAQFALLALFDF